MAALNRRDFGERAAEERKLASPTIDMIAWRSLGKFLPARRRAE